VIQDIGNFFGLALCNTSLNSIHLGSGRIGHSRLLVADYTVGTGQRLG
jgi:hypothetical protein